MLVAGQVAGQACGDWQLVQPLPSARDFADVDWGAGRYVAVGAGGVVLASPDPVSWEVVAPVTAADLAAVTWTGELFVAAGQSGAVLVSADGLAWQVRESGSVRDLHDVAVGPPGLIAVGAAGAVLAGGDGATWRERSSGVAADLNAALWLGSQWLVVGDGATALVSADGEVWAALEVPDSVGDLRDAALHDGSLVVVGSRSYRFGSVDADLTGGWLPRAQWRALASCGDYLVAVADAGRQARSAGETYLVESSDRHQNLWLSGVACGPHGVVAVGRGGQVAASADGRGWRHATAPTSLPVLDLASGAGAVVAVAGYGESGAILTSADGARWAVTEGVVGREPRAVAFGNGRWVVVGGQLGNVWHEPEIGCWLWTSSDGTSWDLLGLDGPLLESVTWDGQRFLALGRGQVAVSESGDEWEWRRGAPDEAQWIASNGTVTVVASRRQLHWSRDLATWAEAVFDVEPVDPRFRRVAAGGNGFVAVGAGGLVVSSSDGVTWSRRESGTALGLTAVAWTGEAWVAVGETGEVIRSGDGELWTRCPTGLEVALSAVASAGASVVVGGEYGVMARTTESAPGAPPAAAFTWLPAPAGVEQPIRFVDLSGGSPTSWEWRFGDGTTASARQVTHGFPATGEWPVALEVANLHGADLASATVEVVADLCPPPPAPVLQCPAEVANQVPFEVAWRPLGSSEYLLQESDDELFGERTSDRVTTATAVSVERRWEHGPRRFFRVRAQQVCATGEVAGEWSETAVVKVVPSLDDLPGYIAAVPAAASVAGALGTNWRTDVVVHNPHPYHARALLFLLEDGQPCGDLHELELAPATARRLTDVAALLCGEDSAGGLVLAATAPLVASSRSFNATPEGSFGARLAVVDEERLQRPGEVRPLVQLTRSAAYRTNAGVTSFGDQPAAVALDAFDADGTPLGRLDLEVPPRGHLQLTDVFGRLGLTEVADARLAVTVSAGPEEGLLAYASVVDNLSGDAVAQVALPPAPPCRTGFTVLPGADDLRWTSVAFGGGTYVVAGRGRVASSADLETWSTHRLSDPELYLSTVEWNGESFVAVGEVSVTSSDGVVWQEGASFDQTMRSLAWSGREWVAVGYSGVAARSADGVAWESQQVVPERLVTVVWAGDRFVAHAVGGTLLFSADGSSWEVHPDGPAQVDGLAWGAGTLVAVGWRSMQWSADGVTWAAAEAPAEGALGSKTVTWTGDRFVATTCGSAPRHVLESRDGRYWQALPSSRSGSSTILDAAWDGSQLLTVDQWRLTHYNLHDGSVVVSGVAHLEGQGGASWRTDLELVNLGDDDSTCHLTLDVDGVGVNRPTATVSVPAGQGRRLEDVLQSVFAVAGKGAVTVAPEGGSVHVSGRTFDDREGGTVGQHLATRAGAEAMRRYDQGWLVGLRHSLDPGVGFRSNHGVVSVCPEPMTVEVELLDGDSGEVLGRSSLELAPFESRQLNNPLATFARPLDNGVALLTTAHPRCAYHAYASVVDNLSGDPALVPVTAAWR